MPGSGKKKDMHVAITYRRTGKTAVRKALVEAQRRGLILTQFLELSQDWTIDDYKRYASTGEMPPEQSGTV